MENFGASGVSDVSSAVRKKRSNTFHHPRNDSQLPLDYKDASSLSDVSKGFCDENTDCGSVTRKKEINLNLCSSRASFSNNITESESAKNVIKNEDGGFGDFDEASNNVSFRGSNEKRQHGGVDSQRSSKVVLAPANWKSTSNSDGASAVGSSTTKSSRISYIPRLWEKSTQSFCKLDGLAEEIRRYQAPVELWRKFIYCTSLSGLILGSVDHMQPSRIITVAEVLLGIEDMIVTDTRNK